MFDYFGQFAKGAEAGDMLDLALASVALPTIYSKAIDTFSETNKSSNKKNEHQNHFSKLVPKPPINMTKDVSKEVKNIFSDDFNKPMGGFQLAKVPVQFEKGFGKQKIRMNGGDSNFAGDNILEHSDRNIIYPS